MLKSRYFGCSVGYIETLKIAANYKDSDNRLICLYLVPALENYGGTNLTYNIHKLIDLLNTDKQAVLMLTTLALYYAC